MWPEQPWELRAGGDIIRVRHVLGAFKYASGRGLSITSGGTRSFTFVELPIWLPVFLFALLPVWWAPKRWRGIVGKKRMKNGQCQKCGYDLRTSLERCPECGMTRLVA